MAFDIKAALAKIAANPADSGDPRGANGYWTGGGGDGGMGEYSPFIPFSKTGSYFNEGMALTPLGDGTYAVYKPAEPGKASRLNGQTYQIVDAGGNVVGQNVWRGITDQNPEQQFAIAGSMMALPMALTAAGVAGAAGGAGAGAAGGAGAGVGAVEAGTMASGVTIGGPMSVGGAAGTALPGMGAMGGMGAGAAGVGAAAGGGGGAAGGLGGMLPTTAQGWAGLISPAMSAVSGYFQNQAAGDAADAQVNAANNGIAENRRQFDVVRGLLQPYVTAGTGALGAYQGLSGLNGAAAQQAEIAALQGSPQFGFLAKQGEDAILANASATGGIRGGNAQHALADSRTALLTSLIDKQLGRYGGVASMGQSSAVGVGNQAMAMGNNNAQLMQQAGAAQAGGVVAGSNAITNALGGIGGFFAGNNASAPAAGGAMNPAAAAALNPTQFGSGTVPGGYGLTARSF